VRHDTDVEPGRVGHYIAVVFAVKGTSTVSSD
jgi:hypothetical protein